MSIRCGTKLAVWREDSTDVQRSMSWEQPKQTAVHPLMREVDNPKSHHLGLLRDAVQFEEFLSLVLAMAV